MLAGGDRRSSPVDCGYTPRLIGVTATTVAPALRHKHTHTHTHTDVCGARWDFCTRISHHWNAQSNDSYIVSLMARGWGDLSLKTLSVIGTLISSFAMRGGGVEGGGGGVCILH